MTIFPRWLSTILSYLAAFIVGAYTYGFFNGHKPQLHQWILTIGFGIIFYLDYKKIRNDNNK